MFDDLKHRQRTPSPGQSKGTQRSGRERLDSPSRERLDSPNLLQSSASVRRNQKAHSESGNKKHLVSILGEELKAGEEIGYKVTVLPPDTEFKWPPPETDKDAEWSGIYCGSKEEALGYMVQLTNDNTGRPLPSKGYLQLIKRNQNSDKVIKMVEVEGEYMADPDVKGDEKAKRVKELLDFPQEAYLMTKLGDQLMIYRGASLIESGTIMKETAIPHALASYFSAEIIETKDW